MTITIRPETPDDQSAIYEVNKTVFGHVDEAELVDRLRSQGFVQLSLVAEKDGRVVGHILFSELQIVNDDTTINGLALAPMAVMPEHQRQAIGSQLVEAGLTKCRELGHRIVIVVGHPNYYPRFGFSPELAARLQSQYAGEAFMALELVPGALQCVTGQVKYPPPFEEL